MRFMIATALILLPATATLAQSAVYPANPVKQCKPGAMMARQSAPMVGVQRLDKMPPATAFRTVYREVDGCPTPVTLRKDIGNSVRSANAR